MEGVPYPQDLGPGVSAVQISKSMAASKSSLKDSRTVVIPERRWRHVHGEVREMAAGLEAEMALTPRPIHIEILLILIKIIAQYNSPNNHLHLVISFWNGFIASEEMIDNKFIEFFIIKIILQKNIFFTEGQSNLN